MKNLIFSVQQTRGQKIATLIFLFLLFGCLHCLFLSSFIPSDAVKNVATWASVLLTILFMIFLLYFEQLPNVKRKTTKNSGRKKLLFLTVIPISLYGLFWVNIAISLPQLFTLAFGEESTEVEVVYKNYSSSRRAKCPYSLRVRKYWLVSTCISEKSYNDLPENDFKAEFVTLHSVFGVYYKTFTIINNVR
jgi:magnesium-transporting ATPase (P-type)